MDLSFEFFAIILAAVIGGSLAKLIKIQPFIGFIVAGVIFRLLFPLGGVGVEKLAEIGLVFLLFSIGLELSLTKLARVLKIATLGAFVQIVLVTALSYLVLVILAVDPTIAIILSLGFSLSSTAIVVKILLDRGESETVHGEVMIGWLLVQDLAVIPMLIMIPTFAKTGSLVFGPVALALVKAVVVIGVTLLAGRLVMTRFFRKVTTLNSRELLLLSAVALALGTAYLTSLFGISLALGAFLAGVLIAESQESHAIFSETRPLRDLFVAIFFVSLGFLIMPQVIFAKMGIVLAMVVFVMVVKFIVVLVISFILGYHGKTALASAVGLSQIGEFSFILLSLARDNNLIPSSAASIGFAVTLLTLIITPFLYRGIVPVWRLVKKKVSPASSFGKILLGWDRRVVGENEENLKDHIILCGYGRVGSWVGRALKVASVPFVVVEYNREIVFKLRQEGTEVIYGDPAHPEVLEIANLASAKAIVIAIPDKQVQEEIIAYSQTKAPQVKIISRVHTDEEWKSIKQMKVNRLVQPEFEAAVAITRSIFLSMGKTREEISDRLKNLRLSKAMT